MESLGIGPGRGHDSTKQKRTPLSCLMKSVTRESYLRFINEGGVSSGYFSEEKNRETFKRFQNDSEIVLEAIKTNRNTIKYTGEELKLEKGFILEAVKEYGHFLEYANKALKNDREVVLQAVRSRGRSLESASEVMKNDREVVLEAVKMDGKSLQFASEELKKDKEIVLEAAKKDGYSLEFASKELKNDKEIFLKHPKFIKLASEELRNDKEVVLEAVKKDGRNLQFVSEDLKNDREVVLEAVKKLGYSLRFASEELKNSLDFVCLCVSISRVTLLSLGTRFLEASILARKMRKYVNDLESAYEEFEQEEYETQRKRNEIDDAFAKVCFGYFKKREERIGHKLYRKGMELREKLKERKISLCGDSYASFDLEKHLESFERELSDSNRDLILLEEVRKWKLAVNALPKDGIFYELINPNPLDPGNLTPNESMWSKVTETRRKLKEKMSSFKDLKLFRLLGRGTFGSAYLCKINGFPGLFVVKLYHRAETPKKGKEYLEKDSLYLPDHPNTVPVLYHSQNEELDLSELPDYEEFWRGRINAMFASSHIQNGGLLIMKYHQISLQKCLNFRLIRRINEDEDIGFLYLSELHHIVGGVLLGVSHLHKNMIVHRDLHPGNIFVHPPTGRVWIGDFGCSLDLRKNKNGFLVHKDHEIMFSVGNYVRFNKTGGASDFCSPEIKNFDPSKDDYLDYSKSDLYSCGVLANMLFELLISHQNWTNSSIFLDFVKELMLKDYSARISVDLAVKKILEFGNQKNFFDEYNRTKTDEPGQIDGQFVDCTANFFICKFVVNNETFRSSIHFFQASKCVHQEERKWVMNASTGRESWSRGRRVKIREGWDAIRLDTMYKGNLAKFQQNERFKKILVSSKSRIKFSGNSFFWSKWNAIILERIREELRDEKDRDEKLLKSHIEAMRKFRDEMSVKLGLIKKKE